MKKFVVLSFVLLTCLPGITQKVYFVYFESENQQPFFARLNDKVYSSSASGYLILSNLKDSSYNVNIGFPGSQSSDYSFAVTVNKKDQGYVLKNMGNNGWNLFNLQTMALLAPIPRNTSVVKTEKKEVTTFTDMLSKAVDDSTLKEKKVLAKEEKKEEVKPPAEMKEETKTNDNSQPNVKAEETRKEEPAEKKEEIKKDPIENVSKEAAVPVVEKKEDIQSQGYKRSIITRGGENSTTLGFGLTFYDKNADGNIDTIRILIPNPVEKKNVDPAKTEEKKFLDLSMNEAGKKPIEENANKLAETEAVTKNNCSILAVQDDFFDVRKEMAGEVGDDNMIAAAMKTFSVKCFSTQQVKNLSTLFLSDEGKYKFFDAVYSHVSDVSNFPSLQSELKDDYFIRRFKAMLR